MLNVRVYSFSYKDKIPNDPSGNGGGYVFDCRGILNPGRLQEYKTQTGRDEAVQDFLITKTEWPVFIENVKKVIDVSLQNYIEREFEHLMISFGCTGGQHRSVFSADRITEYINTKYKDKAKATVHHVEQEKKNWQNG